jgi:hypothetical protein
MKIIYEALYNSCVHESSAATISIHESREGAEQAIKDHKELIRSEFEAQQQHYLAEGYPPPYKNYDEYCEFMLWWGIHETSLLP